MAGVRMRFPASSFFFALEHLPLSHALLSIVLSPLSFSPPFLFLLIEFLLRRLNRAIGKAWAKY